MMYMSAISYSYVVHISMCPLDFESGLFKIFRSLVSGTFLKDNILL